MTFGPLSRRDIENRQNAEIVKLNARLDEAIAIIRRRDARIEELTAAKRVTQRTRANPKTLVEVFCPGAVDPNLVEVFEHEGQDGVCVCSPRGRFCLVTRDNGSQELQLLHEQAVQVLNGLAAIYPGRQP